MNTITSTIKKKLIPNAAKAATGGSSFKISSLFNLHNIEKLPPDALFDLKKRYTNDLRPDKIDLGIGAYRDKQGNTWILPSVKELEQLVQQDPNYNHEYLPIAGLELLKKELAKLILGDESPAILENRIVSVQSLSGTGALHMLSKFIHKFVRDTNGSLPTVYLSGPTWGNHLQIFQTQGLKIAKYPYWNNALKKLDMNGMLALINNLEEGSVFLLHTCAHNPTGMDPTKEEWHQILDAIIAKNHLPIFDSAYQGFTSGSLEKDSWVVRTAGEKKGFPFLICQSFAKNFGMYGERVGCFHVVLPEQNDAVQDLLLSQFQRLIRTEISNPPLYGAKVVAKILSTPSLKSQWEQDLQEMSSRIIEMRKLLRDQLVELKTPGTWDHIVEQQGMFSFTGLSTREVARLEDKHAVYMLSSGRISMAGVNEFNVDKISKSINEVVKFYESKSD